MLHPSTRKLIDRLAEMTELGKLDWTEGDNGSLVYSTEGYSVCLPDGANEIVITSIDGKELERATADELTATMTESGTAYTKVVAGMASEAARIARGTEAAISSLLAGMDEPEPAAVETEAEELGPEDPGDEVAAMASEGVVAHDITPSDAPEADIETAAEADAESESEVETVTAAEIETSTLVDAEPEMDDDMPSGFAADTSDGGEASETEDASSELAADSTEENPDVSGEVVSLNQDTGDTLTLADDVPDAIDTESDVTEAVARLADEVNSRDESEPANPAAEATSAVGVAAATAVGAVASAAGLDESDDEADTVIEPDQEHVSAQPLNEPAMETSTTTPYVPFGLEDSDGEDDAAFEPEVVAAPEAASRQEDESETDGDSTERIDAAPVAAATIEPATDRPSEPEPAEPDVSEPADQTPAWTATSVEEAPHVETEPATAEPVDSAADAETPAAPPQTYSLSGIGAGFGLGALSAKTEASGIPGPSADVSTEAEKIIIDATEDVLPEIEGNLNQPLAEKTASEISFGNANGANTSEDSNESDESDGDILKPRTRFNPWD